MGQEPLVDGKETFGADCLAQAVEDALVQVSVLVVESGHYRVYKFIRVSTMCRSLAFRRPAWRLRGKKRKPWEVYVEAYLADA
jgi:hypothetical protein